MNPPLEEIRRLAEIEDPVIRARESGELLARVQEEVAEVSHIRREAVQELISMGLSHAQIAKKTGVSPSRIGQIAKSGDEGRDGGSDSGGRVGGVG